MTPILLDDAISAQPSRTDSVRLGVTSMRAWIFLLFLLIPRNLIDIFTVSDQILVLHRGQKVGPVCKTLGNSGVKSSSTFGPFTPHPTYNLLVKPGIFMMQEAEIIEQLSCLQVTREFEQSIYQTTGLNTLGIWNLACASLQKRGHFLSVIVVPVWLGESIIGVLQTGRVMLSEPKQFAEPKKEVSNEAASKNPNRSSNRCIPLLSWSCYEAMVDLLEIFAQQLSFYANQIVIGLDRTRTVPDAGGSSG